MGDPGNLSECVSELMDFLRVQHGVAVAAEDCELLDTGLLDSLVLVELIVHIEQRYGTTVDIDDLDEHFHTLGAIARYLAVRRQEAPDIAG